MKLPPEVTLELEEEKEGDTGTHCMTHMSQYAIKVPRTAIAGLTGEMADRLHDIQDHTVRVSPVAQAWTPTGDIFISGNKGHLLKISASQHSVRKYFGFFGGVFSVFCLFVCLFDFVCIVYVKLLHSMVL